MLCRCWSSLQESGIDILAYTHAANAADLDALIRALGVLQVDLFGQSYGTNLALTYMGEYGNEGFLRSVVLDGILPPQVNLFAERGVSAQSAWEAVFAACEADSACQFSLPRPGDFLHLAVGNSGTTHIEEPLSLYEPLTMPPTWVI
jgi:pimeloyl-ACP methyl ester carboxylesterase